MNGRHVAAPLALALLFVCLPASRPARAELTTDPTTRHRVDLRLERVEGDGGDLGIGTHLGRLRVRLPVGAHSVECLVPWARFSVDADLDDTSDWSLGNVSAGFAFHPEDLPYRVGFALGLPTAPDGPFEPFSLDGFGLLYGISGDFVPNLESYVPGLNAFYRLHVDWRARLGATNLHTTGEAAYIGIDVDGRDLRSDGLLTLGLLHETNDEFLLGGEVLVRQALGHNTASGTESDVAFEVGRRVEEWQVTARLRLPLDEERRDAGILVFGLQVAFLPGH